MKNNSKIIERNLELSTEFSRYLFEHPEMEKDLPDDAEIILLPEFDKELKEHNLNTGKQMEAEGDKVVYLTITELRPKIISRIEGIKMVSV